MSKIGSHFFHFQFIFFYVTIIWKERGTLNKKLKKYQFPAIRGIQAKKEYFVIMCPLKLIPDIFRDENLPLAPPTLRAQRILNKARIPSIKKYILENPTSFVFSSITASIDGDVKFKTSSRNYKLGILEVPQNAKFVINDGQHRIAAIKEALKVKPELEYETISIVFYIDLGLKRSQQIFTDLNRFTVKPTPSISILFDYRDPLAELSRYLVESVYYFKGLVEYEKTSISNRSNKLFTLNGVYNATKELLGKNGKYVNISHGDKNLAKKFWTKVGDNILEWGLVKEGLITPYDLRRKYIHAHGLFLTVMGKIGNYIFKNRLDLNKYLSNLGNIEWERSHPQWEGIALNNGKLSKALINVTKTTEFLLEQLGLHSFDSKDQNRKEFVMG